MPAVAIVAIVLFGIFLLLRFLPAHVLVSFSGGNLRLAIRFLCFTIPLPKKKPDVPQLLRLLAEAWKLVRGKFRRKFRLHVRALKITVGTQDAAATAMLYGTVAQGLSYLLEFVRSYVRLTADENAVAVMPDFAHEALDIEVDAVASASLLRILHAGIVFLWNILHEKKKKVPAAPVKTEPQAAPQTA